MVRSLKIYEVTDLHSRRGHISAGVVRSIGNPNNARGIAKRQRPNQQRIHHAENRGARSDPEPDNQNREARESGVTPQRSKRISNIAPDRIHQSPLANLDAPQLDQSQKMSIENSPRRNRRAKKLYL